MENKMVDTQKIKDIKDKSQYIATGRRKVSRARIRLVSGEGKIVVNERPFEDYFTREVHRIIIRQPIKAVKAAGKFDIYVNVGGGGVTEFNGSAILFGFMNVKVEKLGGITQSQQQHAFGHGIQGSEMADFRDFIQNPDFLHHRMRCLTAGFVDNEKAGNHWAGKSSKCFWIMGNIRFFACPIFPLKKNPAA